MNANQFYDEAIKPISNKEKLIIARLIISDIEIIEPEPTETAFDRLKRVLPGIERISLTEDDLAGIKLKGPLPGCPFANKS